MGGSTLLFVLGGLVVLILLIAVFSIRSQRSDVVEERLGRYTEASSFLAVAEEDQDKDAKKPSALTQRMDSMLANRSFAANWRNQLARADLKLTVSEYFALHIISMFGLAFLAYFILFPQQ